MLTFGIVMFLCYWAYQLVARERENEEPRIPAYARERDDRLPKP